MGVKPSFLYFAIRNSEDVFAAPPVPFPALTDLVLREIGDSQPVCPNPLKFLGGSSHLRSVSLSGISFPELPKILSSCTNLVSLGLSAIPYTGYISPEAIFTALCVDQARKILSVNQISGNWQGGAMPTLPARIVLSALSHFWFKGGSKYLEDLVSRIDAPLLDHLGGTFLNQIIFDTSRLLRFIRRIPKSQTADKVHMIFDHHEFWIEFSSSTQISTNENVLRLGFSGNRPGQQFPCVVRFCRPPHFPIPTLEYLFIGGGRYSQQSQQNDVEITQ
jgi:hypothetical protein